MREGLRESSRRAALRRRNRQIIFVAVTICLVIGLSLGTFGILSRAQAQDAPVSYKYFKSILVMPGDTLSGIAVQYADHHYETLEHYVREVTRMNHLQGDEIRAGEYLVVPYYSEEFR